MMIQPVNQVTLIGQLHHDPIFYLRQDALCSSFVLVSRERLGHPSEFPAHDDEAHLERHRIVFQGDLATSSRDLGQGTEIAVSGSLRSGPLGRVEVHADRFEVVESWKQEADLDASYTLYPQIPNEVCLLGSLDHNPEFSDDRASFQLFIHESFDGQTRRESHRIVCSAELADSCPELRRGARIELVGALRSGTHGVEIHATRIKRSRSPRW